MRALILLSLLDSSVATATRTMAFGAAEIIFSDGGLSVHYHGRYRPIEVSKLRLRTNDRQSSARDWDIVALDEDRKTFYFALSFGTSSNRPWIIFSYNLRTGRIRRIVNDYGGGYDGRGVVSPSGRYLAFVGYDVCGVCCTATHIEIADLRDLRSDTARPPTTSNDERVIVMQLRWTGTLTIQYKAKIHNESDCVKYQGEPPERDAIGQVRLSQMHFGK